MEQPKLVEVTRELEKMVGEMCMTIAALRVSNANLTEELAKLRAGVKTSGDSDNKTEPGEASWN